MPISKFESSCFFRTGKSYYPQVFLEECKYIIKEKEKYIPNDIKISSDKPDKEDSDEEKILMKKIILKKKLEIFCKCLF